jgi:predicted Rossmann-fold nucleotide-binding protein
MSDEKRVTVDHATMKVIEAAVSDLWSVVNELSRIRPEPRFYRVAIFGSARTQPGSKTYLDVKRLAQFLAERGCDIVTGGGPGLMAAANEGENLGDPQNHTRSYGVRIDLPFEQGANPFVEKLFTHRTFYSRLAQFVRLSSAFVIVGGGIGTTLEAMMVWQLLQVRHLDDVPLILVGKMWRELVDWASRNMTGGEEILASPHDIAIPVCVDTIDEAMALLEPRITAFRAAQEG